MPRQISTATRRSSGKGAVSRPSPRSDPAPSRAVTALARRTEEQALKIPVDEDQLYADQLAGYATAPNTEKAYRSDFRAWEAYAVLKNAEAKRAGKPIPIPPPYFPITPRQLRGHIAWMARKGLSISTIRRRCAAIARLHSNENLLSPTKDPSVSTVLRGTAREMTVAPRRKKALSPAVVFAAVTDPSTCIRDRALLLFGICSAMRRSEIVAVKWTESRIHHDGIEVKIKKSKADKEGKGEVVALLRIDDVPDCCPVRAIEAWRAEQKRLIPGITKADPIFNICDRTVANAVKRAAKLAGEDPDEYGGHSFRSGFATNAAEAGVAMQIWMRHTRHKSESAAGPYAQVADAMRNPAAQAMSDSLRRAAKSRSRVKS